MLEFNATVKDNDWRTTQVGLLNSADGVGHTGTNGSYGYPRLACSLRIGFSSINTCLLVPHQNHLYARVAYLIPNLPQVSPGNPKYYLHFLLLKTVGNILPYIGVVFPLA